MEQKEMKLSTMDFIILCIGVFLLSSIASSLKKIEEHLRPFEIEEYQEPEDDFLLIYIIVEDEIMG